MIPAEAYKAVPEVVGKTFCQLIRALYRDGLSSLGIGYIGIHFIQAWLVLIGKTPTVETEGELLLRRRGYAPPLSGQVFISVHCNHVM